MKRAASFNILINLQITGPLGDSVYLISRLVQLGGEIPRGKAVSSMISLTLFPL